MPKQTIALKGRKHSIPRCFEHLLYNLEALVGLNNVGVGRFRGRGHKFKSHIEVKYYDQFTPKMKITAYRRRFSQDFYLKVNPQEREYVEEQLKNYRL